ncbi:PAS domain-containing protein [Iodidimonas gelatinilytica]|uniref:PAS domain-containing protein n=1 Tax=Iodidimonas gelatinilytica TaxID=1236966 RepID=UPI001230770D
MNMLFEKHIVSSPVHLRRDMLRELFTYWNSLRNGRFAPSRNDICPSHIPSFCAISCWWTWPKVSTNYGCV